jgi:uncharacterized protein (UPF0332 family)
MPQDENKVIWCLNKARKEIEEGKKHRGLIKVEPNPDEVKKHLKKAEHNLKAVIIFEKEGFSDWSASAAFYTIYHCFLGIILKHGYESRNQECTIALMNALKKDRKTQVSDEIIKSMELSNEPEMHESNLIEIRENYQYGTELRIEDIKVKKLIDLCKEAYEQAQKEIGED